MARGAQNNRLLVPDSEWRPVYGVRDEFTDTVAAGSVNGTAATPGPGTRTVTAFGINADGYDVYDAA